MAKSKYKNWEELRRTRFTEEQVASIDAAARRELVRIDLRELRKMAGKNQSEVAALINGSQSDISKLESGDIDHRISTLRRYVEALGGELQVVAKMGAKSLTLTV